MMRALNVRFSACMQMCQNAQNITWDPHSIGPQVSQSQYAAPISPHNDLNIVTGPVAHNFVEAAFLPEC